MGWEWGMEEEEKKPKIVPMEELARKYRTQELEIVEEVRRKAQESKDLLVRLDALEKKVLDHETAIAKQGPMAMATSDSISALKSEIEKIRESYKADTAKTLEQLDKVSELLKDNLDLVVAVAVAKSHEERIAGLEARVARLYNEQISKTGLSLSIWGNRIAWLALVVSILVLIITALDKLGWIAYWNR